MDSAFIEKLGPLRLNYNSCVAAQNRFDKACRDFTDTEKVYGTAEQV